MVAHFACLVDRLWGRPQESPRHRCSSAFRLAENERLGQHGIRRQKSHDSKVARDSFDLPIAVAGRIRPLASIELSGSLFGLAVDFGAAGLGLRKRPFGGRNKSPLRSVRRRRFVVGTTQDGIEWRSLRHSREEANSRANVKAAISIVENLLQVCVFLIFVD
jgi:hypothetical protein